MSRLIFSVFLGVFSQAEGAALVAVWSPALGMSRLTSLVFLCLFSLGAAAVLAEAQWEASRLSRQISSGARVVVMVITLLLGRASMATTTWIDEVVGRGADDDSRVIGDGRVASV